MSLQKERATAVVGVSPETAQVGTTIPDHVTVTTGAGPTVSSEGIMGKLGTEGVMVVKLGAEGVMRMRGEGVILRGEGVMAGSRKVIGKGRLMAQRIMNLKIWKVGTTLTEVCVSVSPLASD